MLYKRIQGKKVNFEKNIVLNINFRKLIAPTEIHFRLILLNIYNLIFFNY